MQLPSEATMYKALLKKDPSYEGVFMVAVKTTGIFCRPTCPAKKPRRDNCEFYESPRTALLAGYRPCKRCRPLEPEGERPDWIRPVLDALQENPGTRMKDSDLRERGFEPSRVRRWFNAHHGITFQGYQRLLRLGEALGRLRLGDEITQVAYEFGYESLSGFRDAFQRLFNETPGNRNGQAVVTVNRILTPLGPMLAGTSERGICLLEFVDRRMIETQINRLRKSLKCTFVPGNHRFLTQLHSELVEYFDGKRKEFSVPLDLPGSPFTRRTWEELAKIPYGETRSYQEQARMVGNPAAVRAVARANGDNRVCIIVPCHRVIGADGTMTGYGGGIWRKKVLLELERMNADFGERKTGDSPPSALQAIGRGRGKQEASPNLRSRIPAPVV